ncbi:MAG: DUF6477 family protein [Pseudomonadota bacterium]
MPISLSIFQETRPKLLIRAARLAQRKYNRKRMLSRWLMCEANLAATEAIVDFAEMEAEMNALRLNQSFDYRVTDHIELLAAVLYEATLMNSDHPKASGSEDLRSAM